MIRRCCPILPIAYGLTLVRPPISRLFPFVSINARMLSTAPPCARTRVRSGLAKTPVDSTNQRVPLGVTVIPCRRLLELLLSGLGTKFQFAPSKFSVKGMLRAAFERHDILTGRPNVIARECDNPCQNRIGRVALKTGVSTVVHAEPSQCSARVLKFPAGQPPRHQSEQRPPCRKRMLSPMPSDSGRSSSSPRSNG